MIGKVYKLNSQYNGGKFSLVKVKTFKNNVVTYFYITEKSRDCTRLLINFLTMFEEYKQYNSPLYKVINENR